MSISPLKPKRSAGAFLEIMRGVGVFWIDNMRHLQKSDKMMSWSNRDLSNWKKERDEFIERAEKHKIENAVYIVVWSCEVTNEEKEKLIYYYHNKLTEKFEFDD